MTYVRVLPSLPISSGTGSGSPGRPGNGAWARASAPAAEWAGGSTPACSSRWRSGWRWRGRAGGLGRHGGRHGRGDGRRGQRRGCAGGENLRGGNQCLDLGGGRDRGGRCTRDHQQLRRGGRRDVGQRSRWACRSSRVRRGLTASVAAANTSLGWGRGVTTMGVRLGPAVPDAALAGADAAVAGVAVDVTPAAAVCAGAVTLPAAGSRRQSHPAPRSTRSTPARQLASPCGPTAPASGGCGSSPARRPAGQDRHHDNGRHAPASARFCVQWFTPIVTSPEKAIISRKERRRRGSKRYHFFATWRLCVRSYVLQWTDHSIALPGSHSRIVGHGSARTLARLAQPGTQTGR